MKIAYHTKGRTIMSGLCLMYFLGCLCFSLISLEVESKSIKGSKKVELPSTVSSRKRNDIKNRFSTSAVANKRLHSKPREKHVYHRHDAYEDYYFSNELQEDEMDHEKEQKKMRKNFGLDRYNYIDSSSDDERDWDDFLDYSEEQNSEVKENQDFGGIDKDNDNDDDDEEEEDRYDEKQPKEKDQVVNVAVITWNLAESSPSENDLRFLKSPNLYGKSEIIVIGAQEVENIKPRRNEGSRSR